MHNNLLSLAFRGTNSCCFYIKSLTICISNNDAIFPNNRHEIKGNLCPFTKHFYQTVHSTQSALSNNSNGMICGAKYNIKSFPFTLFVRLFLNQIANSKCQRWIHVSNHLMMKKWISFFSAMSLIFCVEIVFFMIHIRPSLHARWRIIFNLKGRFVLIAEMNVRPPMSRVRKAFLYSTPIWVANKLVVLFFWCWISQRLWLQRSALICNLISMEAYNSNSFVSLVSMIIKTRSSFLSTRGLSKNDVYISPFLFFKVND